MDGGTVLARGVLKIGEPHLLEIGEPHGNQTFPSLCQGRNQHPTRQRERILT